jgi:hypothetical protein
MTVPIAETHSIGTNFSHPISGAAWYTRLGDGDGDGCGGCGCGWCIGGPFEFGARMKADGVFIMYRYFYTDFGYLVAKQTLIFCSNISARCIFSCFDLFPGEREICK